MPTDPERAATPSLNTVRSTVAASASDAARALGLVVINNPPGHVALAVIDVESKLDRVPYVLGILEKGAHHELCDSVVLSIAEPGAKRNRKEGLDLIAGR